MKIIKVLKISGDWFQGNLILGGQQSIFSPFV